MLKVTSPTITNVSEAFKAESIREKKNGWGKREGLKGVCAGEIHRSKTLLTGWYAVHCFHGNSGHSLVA